MAKADFQLQIEDLTRLLDITRQIGSSVELVPLLAAIQSAAVDVLRCERATVFLYDETHDELYSRIAAAEGEIRFPAGRGIAGEAARTRQIINVPDAYADPRFNPQIDKNTGFRTRNLLTFPLIGLEGRLVGVLQVLNKIEGGFDERDRYLAGVLSSQTGVILNRQMLLEEYAEKQKLERDLDLAREIQRQMLPKSNPRIDGFDIAGWNRPADQTGGDCFDFLRFAGHRTGILIADATGHGIGPAVLVSTCRAMLQAVCALSDDLVRSLVHVNDLLCDCVADGRFVTTFLGVVDQERPGVEYLSAGQGPLLFYKAAQDETEFRSASSFPLGIMSDVDFAPAQRFDMDTGDILTLLTDGFYEWTDPRDEMFGAERVADLVRRHRHRSAADLIQILHDTATAFSRGTPQRDDLTAVIVKKM